MARGERLSSLAWALAIFAGLLWSAAAMFGMSVPDFSVNVVGPFVADHFWVPIVLAAVIVLLLFDDALDHCICAAWDAVARVLASRAKTAAGSQDTQAHEGLATRQLE